MSKIDEIVTTARRESAYNEVFFSSRYSGKIIRAAHCGNTEIVKASLKNDLIELHNSILSYIEEFPGKNSDEKIANALNWELEINKSNVNRHFSNVNDVSSCRILLKTNKIIEEIDNGLQYFRTLKGNTDKPEKLFISHDTANNMCDKDNNDNAYDVKYYNIGGNPKNKIEFSDYSNKEKLTIIIEGLKTIRTSFLTERRRLFGEKSQFSSIKLFDE